MESAAFVSTRGWVALLSLAGSLTAAACDGTIGGVAGSDGVVGADPRIGPDGVGQAGGTQVGNGPAGASCVAPPARIWKLTPGQIARTADQIFPGINLPTDGLSSTLTRNAAFFSNAAHLIDMSTPHVQEILSLANAFGAEAARRASTLAPCVATSTSDECTKTFLSTLGERAFRRPLTTEELTAYAKYYSDEARIETKDIALTQVARAVFMSPSFLYRTELGDPADTGSAPKLTSFERASAISYFISDGPPDAELYGAAKADALQTSSQIASQATRLIADPKSGTGLMNFMSEHIRLASAATLQKDEVQFPNWSSQIPADMIAETTAFVGNVLWKDDATFHTLLTANYTFANARLAQLYGLPALQGDMLTKVSLPPGRLGLLMQGSIMATLATKVDSHVIHRGRFVRERLLCQPPPPPPINIPPLPPPSSATTQRDRLTAHRTDARCAACHTLMDPIGLGFQNLDAVGAYRLEEAGKPVDASGYVKGVTAPSTDFQNGAELAQLLASVPEMRDCFAGRMFAYASGRDAGEGDTCAVTELNDMFRRANGDIRQLALTIATSDNFVSRTR